MLHEQEFTDWMESQGYPSKTPRVYLKDIHAVQERLSVTVEEVSKENTLLILQRIGNEGATRNEKQIANDQSALNCYHEFRTKLPLPGYRRRGPKKKS